METKPRSPTPRFSIASRALRIPQIVATAPYLYVAANSGSQPVILAGTWFDQVAKMNSWWKLEGGWVSSRDDQEHCLVGFTAARQLGLAPGSSVQLRSGDRNISLTVAGIVTTGGRGRQSNPYESGFGANA